MRIQTFLVGSGAALCCGGLILSVPGVASATFPGPDGDLVWAAICNSNSGQQLFSAAYTASGEQCPGGGSPAYNPLTAGYDDSMPYFSADGSTVYFASQRGGNSAVYKIAYPGTSSGSTDSAVQVTYPNGANDYAPTVNSSGTELAFIRCTSATTCDIWTEPLPNTSGTDTATDTGIATAPPGDQTTGTADRPEFDPVNSNLIVFEGTGAQSGHILLWNTAEATGPSNPTDLSAATSLSQGGVDEHPDWAPDGQALVFDSTRQYQTNGVNQNNGYAVFVMANPTGTPTVTPRWSHIPANTSQIEPVFAPATTNDATADLAWVSEAQGANIVVDQGTSVNSPDAVTANHTNNAQVIWGPMAPATTAPESPLAVALPVAGGAVLVGSGLVLRRRRRLA